MADESATVAPVNFPTIFLGNIPKAATVITKVAVSSTASANSTWKVARIPSNARILSTSKVYVTDMETASDDPTIDIGFAAVNGNISSDVDALNDGLLVTAIATHDLVAPANAGKMAWQYVNGVTADPGGFFDLTVKLLDHPATVAGTIVTTLVYAVD